MASDAPRKVTLRRPGALSPQPPPSSSSAPVSPRTNKSSFTERSATPPVALPSQNNTISNDFRISVHSPTSGGSKQPLGSPKAGTSPSTATSAYTSLSCTPVKLRLKKSTVTQANGVVTDITSHRHRTAFSPTSAARVSPPSTIGTTCSNGHTTTVHSPRSSAPSSSPMSSPLSALTQTSPRHTTDHIRSFSPTNSEHSVSKSSSNSQHDAKRPSNSYSDRKTPPLSPLSSQGATSSTSSSAPSSRKPRPPSIPPPQRPTSPRTVPAAATSSSLSGFVDVVHRRTGSRSLTIATPSMASMLSDSPSSSRSPSPSAAAASTNSKSSTKSSISSKSDSFSASSTSKTVAPTPLSPRSIPQSRGRTTATHALSPRSVHAAHVRAMAHSPRSGVATATKAKSPRASLKGSLQHFGTLSPRSRRALDVGTAGRTSRSPSASSSRRNSPPSSPGLSSLSSSSLTLVPVPTTFTFQKDDVVSSAPVTSDVPSSSQLPSSSKRTPSPDSKHKPKPKPKPKANTLSSPQTAAKNSKHRRKNSFTNLFRNRTRRRSSATDVGAQVVEGSTKSGTSAASRRHRATRKGHHRNRSSTDPLESLAASVTSELGSNHRPTPPKYAPPFLTGSSDGSLSVDELPRGVKVSPRSANTAKSPKSSTSNTPSTPGSPRSSGLISSSHSTPRSTMKPHGYARNMNLDQMSQTVPVRATYNSAASPEILRRAHDSHKTLQAKLMAKLMEQEAAQNQSNSSIDVQVSSAPSTPPNGRVPVPKKATSGLLTVYDPLDPTSGLPPPDSDSQPGSRRSSGWRKRFRRFSNMGRRSSGGKSPSPERSPRLAGAKPPPRLNSIADSDDDEGARTDSVSRMVEKRQTRSRRHAHTSADREKTAQQLDHSKRSSAVHPLSLADVSAYEPVSEQFAEHPQPAPPPPGATSNSRSSPPSAPPIDKFLLANSAGATDSKKKQRSSKKHRKGKKKKESVGKKSSPKFTVEDVYLDDEDRARAPSLPVDLRYEIERKGSTRRRVPESILVKEKFPEIPFLQEIRTVNTAKPGFWKKLRGKKKRSIPSIAKDAQHGGVDFSLVRKHLEAEIGEDFSHLMQESIFLSVHGGDRVLNSAKQGALSDAKDATTLETSVGTPPTSRYGSVAYRSSVDGNSSKRRHHRGGSNVPLGASSRHTLTRLKHSASHSRSSTPSSIGTPRSAANARPPAVFANPVFATSTNSLFSMPTHAASSPFSSVSSYSSTPVSNRHKIPDLENAPATRFIMQKSVSLGKRTGTVVNSRIVGASGGSAVGGSVRVRSSSGALPTDLASEIQQVDITNRSFWNKLRKKHKHIDDAGYDTDDEVLSFNDLHKPDNDISQKYQKESFARIRQLAQEYGEEHGIGIGDNPFGDDNTLSSSSGAHSQTLFRSVSTNRLHSPKPSGSVSASASVSYSVSVSASESKESAGPQTLRRSPSGSSRSSTLPRGIPPLPPSKKAKGMSLKRPGSKKAKRSAHSRQNSSGRRREKP